MVLAYLDAIVKIILGSTALLEVEVRRLRDSIKPQRVEGWVRVG